MGRVQSGAPQRVRETYSELYCGTVNSAAVGLLQLVGPPGVVIGQVMVQNDPTNAVGQYVMVGNQHQQTWRLDPGDTVTVPVDQIGSVWVQYSDADIVVNWLAVG